MKRPVRWEAGWRRSLPPEWEVAPLWAHATCNDEVLPETTAAESRFRYVEISDVDEVQGIIGSTDVTFGAAPSRARRKVREGDVILSTVRTYLRAAAAVDSEYAGSVVSTGFAVIRPRTIHAGYLKHVVASDIIIEEVIARSVGVSYPAINATEVMKLKIPVPPLDEQRRIAAFLDHETARIDELVREQERLRELLRSRLYVYTGQVVRRGLTEATPKVESGNQIVGMVPSHWRVSKLKYLLKHLGAGGTPDTSITEYWADAKSGTPWVSIADMSDREVVTETAKSVTDLGLRSKNLSVWPRGTLLMSMYASLGHTAELEVPAATNQAILALMPSRRLDRGYLKHWLRFLKPVLVREANSNTQDNLNAEKVRNLPIPLPPLAEQLEIARALDEATAAFHAEDAEAERLITLLRERRSALISAAVTGQLDLSNWHLPEHEAVAEVA